ncbi:hypothetical protein [Pacificibacter maritimus]|uniref:hypothetical protein n=1 Tax=Pacificibacter maritimus TaxID=762213 RepID=UPI0011CE3119|nr:hypothetical protein [Pacificibacter maritimus]
MLTYVTDRDSPVTARPFAQGRKIRQLIARQIKAGKPMIEVDRLSPIGGHGLGLGALQNATGETLTQAR